VSNLSYSFAQKIRWLRLLIHSRSSNLNEEVALDILSKLPSTSPVVFDIGANIGLFAKAFNKSPNKPKMIFAFEPSSYVYSILKLTVSRFQNVKCFQLAFDSKNGTTTLSMPLKKSGSIRVGLSHIGETSEGDYLKEEVETKLLDDFAKEMKCDVIDLVKIDVEGAEFEILKGAKRVLTEIRPFWFVEISESPGRFNNSGNDTFNKFISADYAAFYFDKERQWRSVQDYNHDNDYLFVPKEVMESFVSKIS
jgi:FkbM family methyltransferase